MAAVAAVPDDAHGRWRAPVTWPSANSAAGRTSASNVCASPQNETASVGGRTSTGAAVSAAGAAPAPQVVGAANVVKRTPSGRAWFTARPSAPPASTRQTARPTSVANIASGNYQAPPSIPAKTPSGAL